MKVAVAAAFAAFGAVAGVLPKSAPETGTREERFANPPPSSRILPLKHYWPSDVRQAEKELLKYHRQGFGGLACNVHFCTNYLESVPHWNVFRNAVRQMRESGMALWLYDEYGYPSGTAGKYVLDGHPEWAARGALIAVTNVAAGKSVKLKLPPGKFLRAVACPEVDGKPDTDAGVSIDGFRKGGEISWTAPASGANQWCLFAVTEDFIYEGTHTGVKPLPARYINMLISEPTDRFLEVTHDRYVKELGDDFRAFTSTFTDEPSLMSSWLKQMPYCVLPWCDDLPDDYRARTGRDLVSDVPAILEENASGSTAKVRYEFWNMVGERVSRNFMGRISSWAKSRGIRSGGHLFNEEGMVCHVGLYGDFFRCLRALGEPGVDCLTSIPDKVPWLTAQFGGSAGALNASRYIMCEASDIIQQRPLKPGGPRPGYQVSEMQIIGSLNRLIWGGINTFTSYYRWNAFTDEQLRRINLTIGRTVTVMSEGHNAAEVAILYPSEAFMTTYRPGLLPGGGLMNDRVTYTFRLCGNSLFEAGRPFMFVDSRSLGEAYVSKRGVVHGDLRWRVIVLPRAETLSAEALRTCYEFWKAGGVVIAVGGVTMNTQNAFPDAYARKVCTEMFGDRAGGTSESSATNLNGGRGIYLPQRLSPMLSQTVDSVLTPTLSVTENAAGARLRVACRRTERGDIVFVLNDSPSAWRGAVRLWDDADIELWNPATGRHGPAVRSERGICLEIAPHSAVMLCGRCGSMVRPTR